MMDPAVLESLQEIASLLLLVHDYYLKDVYSSNILISLYILIHDAQLHNVVSILDCERMRRDVMPSNGDEMGYELFYEWLRSVAQFVFRDLDMSGKKALHRLLVRYIIPFASKIEEEETTAERNKSLHNFDLPYYTESALKLFVSYHGFILHWYHELVHHVTASACSCNTTLWGKITRVDEPDGPSPGLVRFRDVQVSLLRCKVVPQLIAADQAESIILLSSDQAQIQLGSSSHLRTGSSSDASSRLVSFASFLYFLELLSENVSSKGTISSDRSPLSAVLEAVTQGMWRRTVTHFMLYERTPSMFDGRTPKIEVVADEEERVLFDSGSMVSSASLLWLLRQAGALYSPHNHLPAVVMKYLNEYSMLQQHYANNHNEGLHDPLSSSSGSCWPSVHLDRIVLHIVQSISPEQPLIEGMAGAASNGSTAALLAQLTPALLTADPAVEPRPLADLYTPRTAGHLFEHMSQVDSAVNSVWDAIDNEADEADEITQTDYPETMRHALTTDKTFVSSIPRVKGLRIIAVIEYLNTKRLIPLVVTERAFLDTCSLVAKERFTIEAEEGKESLISQACFVEVLFVIVHDFYRELSVLRQSKQLSSSSWDDPSAASPPQLSANDENRIDQLFDMFMFLLEFDFPASLPTEHCLQHMETSHDEDAGANVRKESAQGIITGCHSSEDDWVSHPLRDVAVLLLHFPSPSLQLTPWAMKALLLPPSGLGGIRSSSSSSSSEESSSSSSEESLTALLEAFSDTFGVQSNQLSQFFAQFYSDYDSSSSSSLGSSGNDMDNVKHLALRNKTIDLLMMEQVLKLLQLNNGLLKWEYARAISRFKCSSSSASSPSVSSSSSSSSSFPFGSTSLLQDDPLTDNAVLPLLHQHLAETRPDECFLPLSSAIRWIESFPTIDTSRAIGHLQQVLYLAGNSYLSWRDPPRDLAPRLTYSSFLVFAVLCFSDRTHGTAAATADKEARDRQVLFVVSIRDMLNTFSKNLTKVQQSLRMKILRPLFGVGQGLLLSHGVKEAWDSADVSPIVTASLSVFNMVLTASTSGSNSIPPRPPLLLWDAPRFVEFCKVLGISNHFGRSHFSYWTTFGVYLTRHRRVDTVGAWSESIVSPIPIKVSHDDIRCLMEMLIGAEESGQKKKDDDDDDDSSMIRLYYSTLAPVIGIYTELKCNDMSFLLPAPIDPNNNNKKKLLQQSVAKYTYDNMRIEDLFRYGGCALQRTLRESGAFVRDLFDHMTEQTRSSGVDRSLFYCSDIIGILSSEVPLNLVCRHLSCHNLLRMGVVAVQAKRSLHTRIRPHVYTTTAAQVHQPSSADSNTTSSCAVTTLCFVEFEELVIRCAFVLWSLSGALLDPDNRAEASALLQTHDLHKRSSVTAVSSRQEQEATSRDSAVNDYIDGVTTLNKLLKSNSDTTTAVAKSSQRDSWGVDFLYPYMKVLQNTVGGVKQGIVDRQQAAKALDSAKTKTNESLSTKRASADDDDNAVGVVESSCLTAMTPPLLVSSPGRRAGSRRRQVTFQEGSVESSYPVEVGADISCFDSLATEATNGVLDMSPMPIPRHETNKTHFSLSASKETETTPFMSPSTSTKSLFNTSIQIIQSSSERFQLMQSSSEQFVIALETLLAGTKEALWPIYATYCSCGDSIDPGTLSGPNLFTLLSKLGALTDRTALSKVGILLHHTAHHSMATSTKESVRLMLQQPRHQAGSKADSPSLKFEEFIVFLCAFSFLQYQGDIITVSTLQQQQRQQNTTDNSSSPHSSKGSRHRGRGNNNIESHTNSRPNHPSSSSSSSVTPHENWFKQWQQFMGSSTTFRAFLEESMKPILQKQMLLAFPEDARLRDRYSCIFSLEVLLAIEKIEKSIYEYIEEERTSMQRRSKDGERVSHEDWKSNDDQQTNSSSSSRRWRNQDDDYYGFGVQAIISALKRIKLIPRVMDESQVLQLVDDVLPEADRRRKLKLLEIPAPPRPTDTAAAAVESNNEKNHHYYNHRDATASTKSSSSTFSSPHWEWILSVVAFHTVETAMQQANTAASKAKTKEDIPGLVANVLLSIGKSITRNVNEPPLT